MNADEFKKQYPVTAANVLEAALIESNVRNRLLVETMKQASELLKQYLDEHPEHDQGDIRVYMAYETLNKGNK